MEAGADVAGVLMGSPASVGDFCRERGTSFACYADPDRAAYRAFGLAAGPPTRWLLNPNIVRQGARLLRRGVAVGLPHTGQDVRQMPGTFVVARGGTVRLAHYGADAADNPDMEVILGALGA